MNTLKLSVIIPIHNADRLLSSCLESIRNQSFSDYEVLCIDDNSTDNSSEIIKNFASTDARFKYLKINERSASKARNYGMDIAQGEFITFVDADDFVEQNAFEYLLSSIETNAGDVACAEYYEYYEDETSDKDINPIQQDKKIISMFATRHPDKEIIISGQEALDLTLRFKLNHASWAKIYRKSALGNLRFPSEIVINEDALFLFYLFNNVKKVICLPEPIYIYRHTSTSLTRTFNQSQFDILKNIEIMRIYDNNHANKLKKAIDVWSNIYNANLFMTMLNGNLGKQFPSEYKFIKHNLCNNYFNIVFGKDYPYKTKIKALLSFFPI